MYGLYGLGGFGLHQELHKVERLISRVLFEIIIVKHTGFRVY